MACRSLAVLVAVPAAVGLALSSWPTSAPAGASPRQTCDADGGFGSGGSGNFGVGETCSPDEAGGTPVVVGSSNSGPTAYWRREYIWLPDDIEAAMVELAPCQENRRTGTEPSADEQQCFSNSAASWCYTDEQPTRLGLKFRDLLVDARTGAIIRSDDPAAILATECVAMEDLLADPLAGQPPAPPTVEEAWAIVPIETAVVGSSPDVGVTGLDTWLWADDPGTLEAGPVDLRGWEIVGSAQVEEWTWSGADGDESWSVSSATPGSEQDPAGEHTYDVKGDYEITVARAWTGSYTVTGYGITYTVDDLTYEDDATTTYDVVEVVSVVDDPDEG